MLGEDLTEEVLRAVNTRSIPVGWSDTAIIMTPKVNSSKKVTQFRPICLCNVVYKVISKMISAWLKIILSDIVSPTYSAFVPGRMTTNNILVAYEGFYAIKNKRASKESFPAIKLDTHKAYDWVKWSF